MCIAMRKEHISFQVGGEKADKKMDESRNATGFKLDSKPAPTCRVWIAPWPVPESDRGFFSFCTRGAKLVMSDRNPERSFMCV